MTNLHRPLLLDQSDYPLIPGSFVYWHRYFESFHTRVHGQRQAYRVSIMDGKRWGRRVVDGRTRLRWCVRASELLGDGRKDFDLFLECH